ncbi:MAG: thioesterase family protein [Bacillaceae bacterium]|nr:thioesterase family protein [Bacillaceae bacterium]
MKDGLTEGYKETLTVNVTDSMVAQFEGVVVHPVYSTVMMVYHMEWVSRKIILPFLEEQEEGMGAEVNVKHIAPSKIGTTLTISATLVEKNRNIVLTSVEIYDGSKLVGSGEVKQVILPKEKINKLIHG